MDVGDVPGERFDQRRGVHVNCTAHVGEFGAKYANYLHEIASRVEAYKAADNPEKARQSFECAFRALSYKPKFSEKPEYKFSFTETVPTNQSLLIEPTTKPKGNTDALILILTPRAQAPTTPAPQDDSNKPVPDGISTRTYIVEPSFLRLLNEKHQADNALSTQGLLQKEGILFSEKAFANYIPATNTVILRNNKAAHLAFQKILKELASQ